MAPTDISEITRTLQARGPARRSALYTWLRANHAKLSSVLDSPDRSWLNAAAVLAAEGLVGATGQPASPKALRQMWLRVSRDVARAREQAAATAKSAKPHRSRPQRDWTPPIAVFPAGQAGLSTHWLPQSMQANPATAPAGSDPQPDSEQVGRARLAELRRTLAERSGH